MNGIFKLISKWIYRVLLFLSIAIFMLILGFNFLWDLNAVNSQSQAESLLETYSKDEYQLMISECDKLMNSDEELLFTSDNMPKNLKQLSLQYVRVSMFSCEISLYKIPGKGIGYFVKKDNEGKLTISWHNYFDSWDSHEIDM